MKITRKELLSMASKKFQITYLKTRSLYENLRIKTENAEKEFIKKNNLDKNWYELPDEYLQELGIEEVNKARKLEHEALEMMIRAENNIIDLMGLLEPEFKNMADKVKKNTSQRRKAVDVFMSWNCSF